MRSPSITGTTLIGPWPASAQPTSAGCEPTCTASRRITPLRFGTGRVMGGGAPRRSRDDVDVAGGDALVSSARGRPGLQSRWRRRFGRRGTALRLLLLLLLLLVQRAAERLRVGVARAAVAVAGGGDAQAVRRGDRCGGVHFVSSGSALSFMRSFSIARLRIWLTRDS